MAKSNAAHEPATRARLTAHARRRSPAHLRRKQRGVRRRYEEATRDQDGERAAALFRLGSAYTHALVRHRGSSDLGHRWAYEAQATTKV